MRFIILLFISFSLSNVQAQQSKNNVLTIDEEQKIYRDLEKLTRSEWREKFKKEHPRVPQDYLKQQSPVSEPAHQEAGLKKKSAEAFRSDLRFPSEFEELQGVFIAWPYSSGVIDILTNSPYAHIYFQLADAIQKNATVYINVMKAADTSKVTNFMKNKGSALFNYKYLVYNSDAFWSRDFGPIDYYYGNKDSIGWIDLKYYPGRDSDNVLPIKWGKELNIPVRTTPIGFEGGNILFDGRGKMVTSTMVLQANLFEYGISNQRTKDSLDFLFDLKTKNILQYLPHDGGTGHIDLYIDMFDENTLVYAKFPEEMKSIPAFQDYAIATKNIDTLISYKTFDNNDFRFHVLPLPPKDDGSWYTNGNEYNTYTRTYINHLIVNKAIIQPIFHDDINGFKQADDELINLLKKTYPGYTIYPIDMRDFDGSGGSIHCITKEFHAVNPLTIWHYAYDSVVPYQNKFPIQTTIHNNSGIANASIKYRFKGSNVWIKAPLSNTTGEEFIGNIASSNPYGETIEYFIEATSNNGKSINKPITAPAGYYTFKYNSSTSSLKESYDIGLGQFYPNPMVSNTAIDINFIEPKNIKIEIVGLNGSVVKHVTYNNVAGKNTIQINTEEIPNGFYIANIYLNDKIVTSSKLVK